MPSPQLRLCDQCHSWAAWWVVGGGTRPTVGRPPRCRAGGPRQLVGVWAWRFGVGEWALGDIGAYFGGVPKGPCGRRGVRGEGSLWPLCFAEFQSYLLEDKTQQSQLKDLTGFTLRLQRAGSCSRDGHKTPGRRGRQGSHPGPDAGSTPRSVAFRGCRGLWAGGATRLSSLSQLTDRGPASGSHHAYQRDAAGRWLLMYPL